MRNRALRGCLIAIALVIVPAPGIHSKNVRRHSPQNLPEQQTNPSEKEKPSNPDKRGTAELPLVVRPLAAEKTQQEAEEDTRDRRDKRWYEGATLVIGVATLLILIVQAIAFFVQAMRLRQTIVTMKELGEKQSADMQASIAAAETAAEAAKKSANVAEDALTVLEKPYVFIDRRIELIGDIGVIKDVKIRNPNFVCQIGVKYFIINHGRTPAVIKNITTTMLIVDNIPEHRTIMGTPEIPPAIAMAQGIRDGPLTCLSHEDATVDNCNEILRGDKFLFFYGQISYRDVFSYEYLTGFGWRYLANGVWDPAGGDEYNFHMNVSPERMKKAPFRF